MNPLQQIAARINRLVSLVQLSLAADDSTARQGLQISGMLGESRDRVPRAQPFGFSSVPLEGCYHIYLCPGAAGSKGLVVADLDPSRPTGLKAGAAMLYDASGSYVRLNADGTITVKGAVSFLDVITAPDVRTASGVSLENHPHGNVQTGGGESGPPIASGS